MEVDVNSRNRGNLFEEVYKLSSVKRQQEQQRTDERLAVQKTKEKERSKRRLPQM